MDFDEGKPGLRDWRRKNMVWKGFYRARLYKTYTRPARPCTWDFLISQHIHGLVHDLTQGCIRHLYTACLRLSVIHHYLHKPCIGGIGLKTWKIWDFGPSNMHSNAREHSLILLNTTYSTRINSNSKISHLNLKLPFGTLR